MALKIGFSPAALKDYTYIYIQKDIYIYIKMESGLQNPQKRALYMRSESKNYICHVYYIVIIGVDSANVSFWYQLCV